MTATHSIVYCSLALLLAIVVITAITGCNSANRPDTYIPDVDAISEDVSPFEGVWRWRNQAEPRGYYVISASGMVKGYHGDNALPNRGQLSFDGQILRMDSIGEPVWFDLYVKSPDFFVEKSWYDGQRQIELPNGDGWERIDADKIPDHLKQ